MQEYVLKPITRQLPRLWRTPAGASLQWIRDRFPLTLQGVLILSVALLMLWWLGYRRMDLVVFALTVCAVTIVAASMLLVIGAGILLRRRLNHASESTAGTRLQMEAGYPNETGFSLPALPWLPLVSLQWRIVSPGPAITRNHYSEDGETIEERLVPLRRCRSNRMVRRFTVTDALGLCRFSWRQPYPADLLVLPQTGPVRSVPMLRSLTSEDGLPDPAGDPEGDRMEIRRYTSGDSIRHIMWQVYARTRQLNIRLPERSVSQSERTLAYLVSSEDDEAAAAVARVALESGALGEDWLFSADGAEAAAADLRHALRLVAGSRALDGNHPWGLDDFLAQHGQGRNTHVVLFAAAQADTDWPARLHGSLSRFGGRCSIILATDGLKTDQRPDFWRWLLFRSGHRDPASERATPVEELRGLLARLQVLSDSLMVVDRRNGQCFDHRLNRV